MSKVRTLFVIDLVIAAAFLVAGASAVAFLVPFSAIEFATASVEATFLGLGYGVWHTLHLYSGLVMIVGGLIHFVMHWSWMTKVAKSMLPGTKSRKAAKSAAKTAADAA
ncbi:MAG: DUF4405 domain-containing protein [Coriobacteriia bacterium]|nr:DUF4405 domain-containing protein [Coriobacteriia bacterium]MBN2823473.1 DUF4405 domain-containing protein [Coriobacteriia bacterium]